MRSEVFLLAAQLKGVFFFFFKQQKLGCYAVLRGTNNEYLAPAINGPSATRLAFILFRLAVSSLF